MEDPFTEDTFGMLLHSRKTEPVWPKGEEPAIVFYPGRTNVSSAKLTNSACKLLRIGENKSKTLYLVRIVLHKDQMPMTFFCTERPRAPYTKVFLYRKVSKDGTDRGVFIKNPAQLYSAIFNVNQPDEIFLSRVRITHSQPPAGGRRYFLKADNNSFNRLLKH